ncbi:hypothetical protein A1QI_06645 [Vibrio genomosp. F10 str. 9ZB36]|nr:hypothetical protein A1QK_02255 [Vibrio genomosp. F10 str. 9ZD137]OEF06308.1 hypothetical protein A1QI_06645 [Vibrio genomosp. F10 str. 9ZB36]
MIIISLFLFLNLPITASLVAHEPKLSDILLRCVKSIVMHEVNVESRQIGDKKKPTAKLQLADISSVNKKVH